MIAANETVKISAQKTESGNPLIGFRVISRVLAADLESPPPAILRLPTESYARERFAYLLARTVRYVLFSPIEIVKKIFYENYGTVLRYPIRNVAVM